MKRKQPLNAQESPRLLNRKDPFFSKQCRLCHKTFSGVKGDWGEGQENSKVFDNLPFAKSFHLFEEFIIAREDTVLSEQLSTLKIRRRIIQCFGRRRFSFLGGIVITRDPGTAASF
ncbi:hypothetical protein CEXT_381541 [Caerostris extrusa]|uniref:Uncharacterized protein n=1 Tax=Caerostris extrusa TaxID=172846 RepID=A0AAV4WG95_CAEEX|nr:hypothetical protein CEXT_381541 [Caerostris extrusa]